MRKKFLMKIKKLDLYMYKVYNVNLNIHNSFTTAFGLFQGKLVKSCGEKVTRVQCLRVRR